MNSIKVAKLSLLAKLKANRASHSEQFERAAQGHRAKVIEALEASLAEAKSGKTPKLAFNLPAPIDQTKTYDKAIGMLEMSIDDIIELEEHDFQQYVMDEWTWSAQTFATNSMYAGNK